MRIIFTKLSCSAFKEHNQNLGMDDLDESIEYEKFSQSSGMQTKTAENSGKSRSSSNEGATKSLLANLFESARTRLSSIELVNGLMPTAAAATASTAATTADSNEPISPQISGIFYLIYK